MNPTLLAALEYREYGYHPIPIEPRGKRPLVRWQEFQERQPTVEELRGWWEQTPDANVALVLGRGTFAVDCDSAEAWERVRAHVPSGAPIQRTAKGYHAIVRGNVPDRVGALPGVDVRGVGYIVAAPSTHPSGAKYDWISPPYPVALLPDAGPDLLALATKRQEADQSGATSASTGWLAEALAGVAEGGRDQTCTRLAGFFLGRGIAPEVVEALLLPWADRCDPPFPHSEVAKCVASIAKREGPAAPEGLPPSAAELIAPTMQLILTPDRPVRRTGFAQLDSVLDGGLEPGTLTLLGGLPGTGKTALALQIARKVARAGAGALILTLEMAATRLMRRLMAAEAGVRFRNLKTGDLTDIERGLLDIAQARMAALPLWIETRVNTVEALSEILDRFDPGQIGLVVIDYLQRMRAADAADKYAEVGHVSRALTALAVQRDLPVLALSSLNRPQNAGPNWRPKLNNLRESGQLEYDGDNVLLAYREDDSDELELRVAKQRDGEAGVVVKLHFRGEYMTFEEAA